MTKVLRRIAASALFVVAFVLVYHANGSVLDEGDSVAGVLLPVALLADGGFSFSPERFPELFKWKTRPPFVEEDDFVLTSFEDRYGGKAAAEWRRSGQFVLHGPKYYLTASRHGYVSTFGPIPGLLMMPLMAPLYAVDHQIHLKSGLRAAAGKLFASMLVAACALVLFSIAGRYTTASRALFLSCVYGFGTCAWSVSSQALWQQTLDQSLLAFGALFLTGRIERRLVALFAGFFFAAAAASRPTAVVFFGAVLWYLAVARRRSVVPFLLGALPPVVFVALYDTYYFGGPFTFGQEVAGHAIALAKTGSPELWQTPFFRGLAGLLVSPSRGLFVFSPVLVPAAWGMVRVFRDPKWDVFRPLAGASIAVMAIQCKWFDWWGGHAYGFRPWFDVMPFLVLFLLPVLEDVLSRLWFRAAFGVALAWSLFVQALGSLTYDRTWNLRTLYVVRSPRAPAALGYFEESEARDAAAEPGSTFVGPVVCDVDLPYCRYRLWSMNDNVIRYYATHFEKSRRGRLPPSWSELGRPRAVAQF